MTLNDAKLRQIRRAFEQLAEVKITVGLQGNLNSDVVMRGFWTEYGTEHMPAWGWQRKAATIYEKPITTYAAKAVKKMMLTYASVHRTYLDMTGLLMQDLFQRQIRNTTTPAISEYTARKKGSEKPLIDTGQMINSIKYEILGL